MTRRPFLVVGDGPQEPSGLGRIARELVAHLVQSRPDLDVVHVGGPPVPTWDRWPHVPMGEAERGTDWGARYVEAVYRDRFGTTPGFLFAIWDPSRLYDYLRIDLPVERWGYFAVDSANRNGSFGGPAAEVVRRFDRVLAYTRYGSEILRTLRPDAVSYLPHGLVTPIGGDATEEEAARVDETLGPYCKPKHQVIGCVATNQARKDLALYCETLTELRARGHRVYGWLHTDVWVKDWAIAQLIDDCGLHKAITVTTDLLTDAQLYLLYQRCSVTVAPGLGEGFGYPIVESLQAGTPVVHGDWGGGAELIPKREWRFPVRERRLESVYALQRPVYRAADVANAIERAWQWEETVGAETAAAYLRGCVAHLEWRQLWGRWASWIGKGLAG